MPSASAYSQSPGRTQTPWICTATSRCPSPRRSVGNGINPSARRPTAAAFSSATSRTQPSTTRPAQPLRAAAAARLPPTRARRSDPPPSTTSTRPSPGDSTAALTCVLSSWHLTVLTGPANAATPPKLWKTGGKTRKDPLISPLCSSQKSQVLKGVEEGAAVMFRKPFRRNEQQGKRLGGCAGEGTTAATGEKPGSGGTNPRAPGGHPGVVGSTAGSPVFARFASMPSAAKPPSAGPRRLPRIVIQPQGQARKRGPRRPLCQGRSAAWATYWPARGTTATNRGKKSRFSLGNAFFSQ